MNSLISAIKAFVLKSRPAYKDYIGNGKYDVKKLPEECVPDSVNNKIRIAQSTANNAQRTANDANSTANDAQRTANNAQSTANDAQRTAINTETQINDVTTFVTVFASLEATKNKERYNFAENTWANGISALPLAESRAPMKCYFDIMLNDSSNHNIKHYVAFEGKIVREVTKRSDTYCLFIDESVEVVNDCFAKLKIGYKFSNDDNLWHKFIRAEVTLPDADYNNTSITTIILNAHGAIPDTYNYAPWPSICVPLAGTNDAGVVYASDKTDDQTVPVSIDKNGYLWCKGSETLPKNGNPGDILVKTETGSEWQKQDQGGGSRYIINGHSWNYNGANYICTDETPKQLQMIYESGKDIFLYFNEERFKYTGSLFYTIMATSEDNTGIKGAAIAVIGRPMMPNSNWNCPYKGICNFGVFPFNIQSEG